MTIIGAAVVGVAVDGAVEVGANVTPASAGATVVGLVAGLRVGAARRLRVKDSTRMISARHSSHRIWCIMAFPILCWCANMRVAP